MVNQLIHLFILTFASVLVMIIHELPKAIIYTKTYYKHSTANRKNVFAIHQYIDPIGLIFCVSNLSGFSKPYVYRLNNKKMNRTLAITGYVSLLIIFSVSILSINLMIYRLGSKQIIEESFYNGLIFYFFLAMATISMGLFLVNLFPIATFDMGLMIASISSEKYYSIISNDYFVKMILLLVMIFGVISNISLFFIELLIM